MLNVWAGKPVPAESAAAGEGRHQAWRLKLALRGRCMKRSMDRIMSNMQREHTNWRREGGLTGTAPQAPLV